ncbi:MAG: ATP-binding protein [Magnetococcus sp. YQC-9]
MFDLARIEAGHRLQRPAPVSLCRLLDELHDRFAQEALSRGTHLEIQCDDRIGLVEVDPLCLRQVLSNLLTHAIHFTERGEITLALRMLKQTTESRTLRFVVEDTGQGIPTEQLKTLFEPVVPASEPFVDGMGGSGLGLAVCRTLVEKMGGSIEVESHPGEGSRFSFSLTSPVASHKIPDTLDAPANLKVAPLTILLIEDDRLSRAFLHELLAEDGHRVIDSDGADCMPVTLMEGERIDLLLIDLRLPECNALAIIRTIRTHPDRQLASIPVVVLTADALPERQLAAFEAGANAVLIKPVQSHRLRAALARIDSYRPTAPDSPDARDAPCADASHPMLRRTSLDAGLRSLGASRFLAICGKFTQVVAEAERDLQPAIDKRDAFAIRQVLHRVAGSSAHLGMEALVEVAEQLIVMLRTGIPADLAERIATFDALLHTSAQALQAWMDKTAVSE